MQVEEGRVTSNTKSGSYLDALKSHLDVRKNLLDSFNQKLKYLYGECVRNGEVIPHQDMRRLIQYVFADDMQKELLKCFMEVYQYTQESHDSELQKKILDFVYLPFFLGGSIQSFQDPQLTRDRWGMDSPEYDYVKSLNQMVSAYWNDIEFKRKEYTDVVADLCSRAINVSTCDVLLYSFGCRFKEFIDGYTLKLTEATKQTTLSKISKRFHEIVRKKKSDKKKGSGEECVERAASFYNKHVCEETGLDQIMDCALQKDLTHMDYCLQDNSVSAPDLPLYGEEEEAIYFLLEDLHI